MAARSDQSATPRCRGGPKRAWLVEHLLEGRGCELLELRQARAFLLSLPTPDQAHLASQWLPLRIWCLDSSPRFGWLGARSLIPVAGTPPPVRDRPHVHARSRHLVNDGIGKAFEQRAPIRIAQEREAFRLRFNGVKGTQHLVELGPTPARAPRTSARPPRLRVPRWGRPRAVASPEQARKPPSHGWQLVFRAQAVIGF